MKGKPASAGRYNSVAFEKSAHEGGLYAKSINGDAFSKEIKQQTIDLIKEDLGQVDWSSTVWLRLAGRILKRARDLQVLPQAHR